MDTIISIIPLLSHYYPLLSILHSPLSTTDTYLSHTHVMANAKRGLRYSLGTPYIIPKRETTKAGGSTYGTIIQIYIFHNQFIRLYSQSQSTEEVRLPGISAMTRGGRRSGELEVPLPLSINPGPPHPCPRKSKSQVQVQLPSPLLPSYSVVSHSLLFSSTCQLRRRFFSRLARSIEGGRGRTECPSSGLKMRTMRT